MKRLVIMLALLAYGCGDDSKCKGAKCGDCASGQKQAVVKGEPGCFDECVRNMCSEGFACQSGLCVPDPDDVCEPGSLNCECRDGAQCDEGLICVAPDRCVEKDACNDPSVATEACGEDCAFAPESIDCAVACDYATAGCPEEGCAPWTEDLFCLAEGRDLDACVAACEDTKAQSCANIGFGCWATPGSNCETVPGCVHANL